jgi:uncharacterized protein (TIGR00730 family)
MPSPDMSQSRLDPSQSSSEIEQKIKELIALVGTDPQSPEADLLGQIISISLRMTQENFDRGQLKLMTRSFKEMRYAYRVFNEYRRGHRSVCIFGSARTLPSHPDYQAAKAFSAAMAAKGWVCMTGAADGIMRAGLEGAPRERSFGLSIRLPFENTNHTILAGDPKLINFRYFFTRKLMFLSHSNAIAAFPGGVGTQDELFEVLTLMQTGRSNIVPLVLLAGEHETYWQAWEHYLQNNLLAKGFINAEDQNLYYRAPSVQEAVDHIQQFYYRYHSSRYVKDILVIRLQTPLASHQIASLNAEFKSLIKQGEIYATNPAPNEDDHLELPRIAFEHNRKQFGLLRAMIDRINAF